MFKLYFVGSLALIVTIFLGIAGFNVYQAVSGIPKDSPHGEYTLAVPKQATLSDIADRLQEKKIINSSSGFLLQSKLNPTKALQEGDYKLALPASPVQIIKQLNDDTQEKLDILEKTSKYPIVTITFNEGFDIDQMIEKLDQSGIAKTSDLEAWAQNPDNFDRVKYDFLPKPLSCAYGNIHDCVKYYIEGYAYPDTYDFFKPSTPGDIFEKMLTNFNRKVWSEVKQDVADKNFGQVVTMASVLERETGRTKGVTDSNQNEVSVERKNVASVFTNRVTSEIKWQSNPTVEYGQDYILCEQTFKRDGCKYLDDPSFKTLYNTYNNVGYPIGPITNPQLDNIQASLHPAQTDYLFFVADATGKTYFGRNEAEHQRIIEEVNKINQNLGVNQ